VAVVGGLVFSQIFMARTSASNGCAFGLTSAGVLYAWGDNTDGELGVGDTTARSSPTLVVGGLNFVSVFSGVDSSAQLTSILAVTATGQLYSWGFNSNGQLGVGDVTPRSSPTLVVGPMNIANVKDKIETNSIPVTPGTTYSISMKNFYATFGTTQIVSCIVDQVIVEYLA
jgi:alpha-tubulin suppressor-like RCC1 family protein